MSTHSSTQVLVGKSVVMNLYGHSDGYLDGHGADLAQFLKDKKLVNGISANSDNIANGMDCLSAQIVAHFKTGPGGFYLVPLDQAEEYEYVVYEKKGTILMQVRERGEIVFDGTPAEFLGITV